MMWFHCITVTDIFSILPVDDEHVTRLHTCIRAMTQCWNFSRCCQRRKCREKWPRSWRKPKRKLPSKQRWDAGFCCSFGSFACFLSLVKNDSVPAAIDQSHPDPRGGQGEHDSDVNLHLKHVPLVAQPNGWLWKSINFIVWHSAAKWTLNPLICVHFVCFHCSSDCELRHLQP